jgi:hypothetical protein
MVAELQQNTLSDLIAKSPFAERYFNAEGQEVPSSNPFVIYRVQATAVSGSVAGITSTDALGKITVNLYRLGDSKPSLVWTSYVAKN